jgi:hypothetical protein
MIANAKAIARLQEELSPNSGINSSVIVDLQLAAAQRTATAR